MNHCQHCGGLPIIASEFFPWFGTRIGPLGRWLHRYCSEACWNHGDEHSALAWERHFRGEK